MGQAIQGVLGSGANGWVVIFVFAFGAVIMANCTGSDFGTMFIMAPIAVSAAVAVGVDPRAVLVAVAVCSASSIILPLDTAMGIAFGRGDYRLGRTLVYTVPLTVLYVVAVCVSAVVVLPFS